MSEADLDAAWETALGFWGVRPRLLPPVALPRGDHPAIAWINLNTRQVFVDVSRLRQMGATHALPALLAHELGHHVRWPHTLGELAALEVLQRRVLPNAANDLTNLFYDLLINQVVGERWPGQIAALYRGCIDGRPPSPVMALVLAVYEIVLGEPILPESVTTPMEKLLPGWRGDAQRLAQTLWELTSVHDQFLYFLCELTPYLDPGRQQAYQDQAQVGPWRSVTMIGRDLPEPSPEDLADALLGNRLSDEAVRRAIEEGWLKAGDVRRAVTASDLAAARTRPGDARGRLLQQISSRLYHSLVDRHLFALPGTEGGPDPEPWLPSTTRDWEPGDDVADIDWVASTLRGGPYAASTLQRRERISEPDDPTDGPATAVEIWLDTSGSMPNPLEGFNAMTLAAQVLAAAAIRRGGRVRAFVWSDGPVLKSDWTYDEDKARDHLLRHIGSGTDFPFDLFRAAVTEAPDVMRVIISDTDLVWCCERARASAEILQEAALRSRPLVLLLHGAPEALAPVLARVGDPDRVRWVPVRRTDDLAGAAADLAAVLWDRPARAG